MYCSRSARWPSSTWAYACDVGSQPGARGLGLDPGPTPGMCPRRLPSAARPNSGAAPRTPALALVTSCRPASPKIVGDVVHARGDAATTARMQDMTVTPGSEFTFVDLFAGIGGIRQAFRDEGGRCVMTSEWNKYARQTYDLNFEHGPDHLFNGDITEIVDAKNEVPDHHILLGGFPCQPFSIAGVSKKNALGRLHGFQDPTQGTVFLEA